MTDKSHVAMEQHICIVCGHAYDTGTILLHKQLRPVLSPHQVTGNKNKRTGEITPDFGMCPEHQQQFDDGYVFIVGADESKSTVRTRDDEYGQDTIKPGEEYRTGDIAAIKREVWDKIFNVPVPEKGVGFAPPEVIEMLRSITTAD